LTHEWKKVWMEPDGTCKGVISLLDTDKGKDIKAILSNGRKLGISSRGLGSTLEREVDGKKIKEIQDDFKLLSPGDWVVAPSVQGAGNIQESLLLMEEKMNKENAKKEEGDQDINVELFSESELTEILKSQYEKEIRKNLFFGSWEEWKLKHENKIRRELGFPLNKKLAKREQLYHLYTEAKLSGWSGTLEEFEQEFSQKYGEKAVRNLEEKVKKNEKKQRPYQPRDLFLEATLAGMDPAEMARRLNEKEGLVVEEKKEKSVEQKINNLRKKYKPSIYDWQDDDEDEPKAKGYSWTAEQRIAGKAHKK